MTDQKIYAFLSSIIEQAAFLRDNVNIPENADFREVLFQTISDADSMIDDANDMVRTFDLSEWED